MMMMMMNDDEDLLMCCAFMWYLNCPYSESSDCGFASFERFMVLMLLCIARY